MKIDLPLPVYAYFKTWTMLRKYNRSGHESMHRKQWRHLKALTLFPGPSFSSSVMNRAPNVPTLSRVEQRIDIAAAQQTDEKEKRGNIGVALRRCWLTYLEEEEKSAN